MSTSRVLIASGVELRGSKRVEREVVALRTTGIASSFSYILVAGWLDEEDKAVHLAGRL